ncbi:hypothetical protein laban61_gp010 [Flavobacterium phage vB_FspS_laban6-1]|uniref:Uncharacterized protein n=1 Tax=Flavobacterium phage vB_FspS_laban6-1 TaxID=2686250 RepID=A0A6B9LGK1_9CAUD|nr:hypothetical protein HWC90_gp10 [Flavobacterium phage vB_FspS_laban6-1]QHB38981.1 hypothetical protein laban61_gp010 [Flavobacterium phage vB_FspS_laban6-1]
MLCEKITNIMINTVKNPAYPIGSHERNVVSSTCLLSFRSLWVGFLFVSYAKRQQAPGNGGEKCLASLSSVQKPNALN